MQHKLFCVYITASRTHTLYIGVTSNLSKRIEEHRQGTTAGFTTRYRCDRLVWFEQHTEVQAAIAREKQLKGWTRARKLALIESENRTWVDLSEPWREPLRVYQEPTADPSLRSG